MKKNLMKLVFVVTAFVLVFALAACAPAAPKAALPTLAENEAGSETETPGVSGTPEAPAENAVVPTVPGPEAATVAPAAAGATAEAMINVATDATLGSILVGNNGMTLYIFTKDTPDTSTCTGNCAALWPPLLTMGNPVAGTGVDASMVGKTQLADGTWIVTYNHWPLYYYAKDMKAGDVTGQKVGGVWFVLGPDGKAIGMP